MKECYNLFSGNVLRDAIISGANNIYKYRQAVDELNVFPVPDGDTGTNMSMSIGNAARALEKVNDLPAGEVAQTAAAALLRGARGNSGVITSLLFRGIAKGLKDCKEVTGENLASALELGVAAAYKAVMKPTEGTMLTVARIAAERASAAAADENDPLKIFEIALDGAKEALDSTPELLPVLKKAGVVDAGGMGLIKIFEGMLVVFRGGDIVTSDEIVSTDKKAGLNIEDDYTGEITFTYCTEFIIDRGKNKSDSDATELREYLGSIGDSLVVVEDEDIIKIHVHTDHPGQALEKGLCYGMLINLKIENMREQYEKAKPATNSARTEVFTPAAPQKHYGFVSVSVGDGLHALFEELGVDTIVSGGQTMNPSTDNILKAIEATPSEVVFVLPNNKNIIMAAEQAVPLSTKKVIVLHTRTIPMGVSAMLAFDPEVDDETNAINMQKAFEKVITGQITFAARDSDYDGHKIKKNDLLAIENGKVVFTDTDLETCTVKLCRQMCKKSVSFLTLFYGDSVDDNTAERIKQSVEQKLDKSIEVTLINGGQPVYYFYISAE